jgi:CheY-like chemotaxis protein
LKKIIIAESIMHTLDSKDTIFGQGSITLYRARSSGEILNVQGARKADLINTAFTLPLMDGAKLCSMIRSDARPEGCIDHYGMRQHCREIVAKGVVIRVSKPAPGKFRHGIKFLNPDTRSLIIIEQFVWGRIKH